MRHFKAMLRKVDNTYVEDFKLDATLQQSLQQGETDFMLPPEPVLSHLSRRVERSLAFGNQRSRSLHVSACLSIVVACATRSWLLGVIAHVRYS